MAIEQINRGLPIDIQPLHDDRRFQAPLSAFKQFRRLLARQFMAQLNQNANGPIGEFGIGRAQIDHEIAVRLAQANERGGGDDVQGDLRRLAGLQARRALKTLGPRSEPDDVF